MKNRKSGIELLKFIAIICIVLSHSIVEYINVYSSFTFDFILLSFIRNLGQFGCVIFIVCSSYFLLESSYIKFKNIFKIIMDTTIVSILSFILCIIFDDVEYISFINITKAMFPILFSTYWFVSTYLLLYLIHPYLNLIIYHLDSKSYFKLCIYIIILFCGLYFLLHIEGLNYSNIIGFIVIYFIVGYVKLHLNKKYIIKFQEKKYITFSILLHVLLFSISVFLSWKFKFTLHSGWAHILNPLFILLALQLFYRFYNYKFFNLMINKLSSLSLLIYVIQCSSFIRFLVNKVILNYIYSYNNLAITLINFICYLLIAVIFSIVYKKLINLFIKI